jgi:hypothetical protein
MIKFAGAEPNTLRTEQIDKLDCLGKDGRAWCIPVEQCRYKPLQVCSNQFSKLVGLVSATFLILMNLCNLN